MSRSGSGRLSIITNPMPTSRCASASSRRSPAHAAPAPDERDAAGNAATIASAHQSTADRNSSSVRTDRSGLSAASCAGVSSGMAGRRRPSVAPGRSARQSLANAPTVGSGAWRAHRHGLDAPRAVPPASRTPSRAPVPRSGRRRVAFVVAGPSAHSDSPAPARRRCSHGLRADRARRMPARPRATAWRSTSSERSRSPSRDGRAACAGLLQIAAARVGHSHGHHLRISRSQRCAVSHAIEALLRFANVDRGVAEAGDRRVARRAPGETPRARVQVVALLRHALERLRGARQASRRARDSRRPAASSRARSDGGRSSPPARARRRRGRRPRGRR